MSDCDRDEDQEPVHHNESVRLSRCALVLPVDPVDRVALEVIADGRANGRKEELFANLLEQSEALELVLYRIFEFGEAQLDAGLAAGSFPAR